MLLPLLILCFKFVILEAAHCPNGIDCAGGQCCVQTNSDDNHDYYCCNSNDRGDGILLAVGDGSSVFPSHTMAILIGCIIVSVILSVLCSLLCCCLVPGCMWHKRRNGGTSYAGGFGGLPFPGTIIISPNPPPSWAYNDQPPNSHHNKHKGQEPPGYNASTMSSYLSDYDHNSPSGRPKVRFEEENDAHNSRQGEDYADVTPVLKPALKRP